MPAQSLLNQRYDCLVQWPLLRIYKGAKLASATSSAMALAVYLFSKSRNLQILKSRSNNVSKSWSLEALKPQAIECYDQEFSSLKFLALKSRSGTGSFQSRLAPLRIDIYIYIHYLFCTQCIRFVCPNSFFFQCKNLWLNQKVSFLPLSGPHHLLFLLYS